MPKSTQINLRWSGLTNSLWLILILLLTVLVYFPLFQNGFLMTWDDNRYILENPYIQNLEFENVKSLFTVYFDGHYHPLTLLSLALDYKIGGFNPKVFHTTNLLLHLFNTLLVFWFVHLLLKKEKRNIALFTALLFGIGTIHVESVAWATERKNVLYAFFYLLSLVIYLRFLSNRQWSTFLLVLLLFVLALLSKSMALPLVFSLIAIDYFHKRRWYGKKELLEKVPFLVLAILFGLIAIWAQKSTWGESLSQEQFSFGERIFYAGYAYIAYGVKLILPVNLAGFYPYPKLDTSFFILSIGALFIIAGIIVLIIRKFSKAGIARFGVLFFSINIFLLLKLFDVPAGDYIMADRYAYVASIGLFLVVVHFGNEIIQRNIWLKRTGIALFVAYIGLTSIMTLKQVSVWRSDEDFFSNVINKCPDAEVAYLNRGASYKKQGRMQLAIQDFSTAIEINPTQYKNFANRGIVYTETGQFTNAILDLSQAAQLSGNRPEILASLGFAFLQEGQLEKAIQQFNRVLLIQPNNHEVFTNRGTAQYSDGKFEGAISDYSRALKVHPKYMIALFNRGLALLNQGDNEGAINDFLSTIQLDPKHSDAYHNMGIAWSRLNQPEKAFMAYNKAIEIEPGNFEAILNRGVDYFYHHQYEKALADFDACLHLNNSMAAAYYFKGLVLINLNLEGGCANLKIANDKGFEMADKMLKNYCK